MTAAKSPLLVVIPSRGRPQHVARTAAAWRATGAMNAGVRVVYALDSTDPQAEAYEAEVFRAFRRNGEIYWSGPEGSGMVAAINGVGRWLISQPEPPRMVAVLNDDHLPRSKHWHHAMAAALTAVGTGIVYGDDLLRGEALCTAWAMTTDIVRATGRIVPCLVSHLFADNAVMALGRAAGVLNYLPDVVIEHVHYTNGKAEKDEGYERVNASARWRADEAKYQRWLTGTRFTEQVQAVKALRATHAEVES